MSDEAKADDVYDVLKWGGSVDVGIFTLPHIVDPLKKIL